MFLQIDAQNHIGYVTLAWTLRDGAGLGTWVDLSDGPLLSIIAARLGAPSVLCIENDHDRSILSRRGLRELNERSVFHAIA